MDSQNCSGLFSTTWHASRTCRFLCKTFADLHRCGNPGEQAKLTNHSSSLLSRRVQHRNHRQPQHIVAAAEHLQHGLHRSRARLPEVSLHQPEEPAVDAPCRRPVVLQRGPNHRAPSAPGITFDATETNPAPPSASTGSAIQSSPAKTLKLRGAVVSKLRDLHDISARLLDANDVLQSPPAEAPSRAPGSRPCARECCRAAPVDRSPRRLRGSAGTGPPAPAVVVGIRGQNCRSIHLSARASARAPRPRALRCACILQRPGRARQRLQPRPLITRSHSASLSVEASPVVPHGIRKPIPLSICQFTSACSAGSSTPPSLRKGVTSAVPQPINSIMNASLPRQHC